MFLWRPVLAEPPLCAFRDLDHLTIDDVADMHEALDLRAALGKASAEQVKRKRRQ